MTMTEGDPHRTLGVHVFHWEDIEYLASVESKRYYAAIGSASL